MPSDPQVVTGTSTLADLQSTVDQLEQDLGALLTISSDNADTTLTFDENNIPNKFIVLRVVPTGTAPALTGFDLVCQGDGCVSGNLVHLAAYRVASHSQSPTILSSAVMAEFRRSRLPLEAQAFLGDISTGEATRFDELAGGGTFSSYAAFPQWQGIPSIIPGKLSHGAGLFQFEPGTWAGIVSSEQPTLVDFSPQSQIVGAWRLARKAYGSTLLADLQGAQLVAAGRSRLRTQWARGAIAGPPGQRYSQLLQQLT